MSKGIDKIFLSIIFILLIMGLFILSSASLGLIARNKIPAANLILKQFFIAFLGVAVMLIFSKINYKIWQKYSVWIFLLSLFLTVLVFLPFFGFYHGGARRWINIGPVFFQPSEFLKFGFILYLSSWLSAKQINVGSFYIGFLPFLVMIGAVASLLIMQPDIGTLGIIAISSGILFFAGGGKASQIGIIIIIGILLIFTLYFVSPYFSDRISVFLNPSVDTQGIGYQLRQSLIAVGSGKIFGKGFGMSTQKFNFLPEPTSDSIFSVFSEEFGFLGSVILVILYLFFLLRGFYISKHIPDNFGRFLTAGFVIIITIQAFINISALLGIIPLTGVPLVFISQGGSSLIMTLAEMGIVLNVSRYI